METEESIIPKLLRLTEENHTMLKKIVNFREEYNSDEAKENRLVLEFITNVTADWWAEWMRNGATNDITKADIDDLTNRILTQTK